ncbi:hypothetical protein IWX64_001792 [Arthrobacter sp. CAN_A212]|uniref:hypothetical protein n=1 Tax=Arthrobacter sp. CAN_A212 TaxID=2787719 RepID=UPI0018CADCB7
MVAPFLRVAVYTVNLPPPRGEWSSPQGHPRRVGRAGMALIAVRRTAAVEHATGFVTPGL